MNAQTIRVALNKWRLLFLSKVTFGKIRQHYIEKMQRYQLSCALVISLKSISKAIENKRHKILEKTKRGQKISVYFIAYEKSQWIFQSVYDAMKKDDTFEPKVLCLKPWQRENVDLKAFENLIEFFENKKVQTVRNLNKNNFPDILFTPLHFFEKIGFDYSITDIYKKTLLCYLPYYWVIEEERVDSWYYSHNNMKFFWKEFVPDKRAYNAALNNPVNGKNVILSGHPKTDEILKASDECLLWKCKDAKKIIWAPHWSMYNFPAAKATFDRYYMKMLNYVEKHPEIQMIIKPHPFLKGFIGDKKMQKEWNADIKITVEEYEEYLEKWKNLPNGNVHDSGDYFDLFKSSDAMILDSMSFILEYGFLNKPMCYLSREATYEEFSKGFNSLAIQMINSMDIAYDWESTELFISKIAKNESFKYQNREKLILEYLSENKGNVGEFIKNNIKQSLLQDI